MLLKIKNEDETERFGRALADQLMPGDIVCLVGDLGTGKTALTKAVAAGLGIEEHIVSPTFNIVKEYRSGRLPLYHFDVYRIGDVEEMDEIGYEEYFYGEGVCLIEWSALIAEILPPEAVHIRIDRDPHKGYDYRQIAIEEAGSGERGE